MFGKKSGESLLIALLVAVIIIALGTYLIMLIWNNVLLKKSPLIAAKKLNFWDALALAVFVSLLWGGGQVCYSVNSK